MQKRSCKTNQEKSFSVALWCSQYKKKTHFYTQVWCDWALPLKHSPAEMHRSVCSGRGGLELGGNAMQGQLNCLPTSPIQTVSQWLCAFQGVVTCNMGLCNSTPTPDLLQRTNSILSTALQCTGPVFYSHWSYPDYGLVPSKKELHQLNFRQRNGTSSWGKTMESEETNKRYTVLCMQEGLEITWVLCTDIAESPVAGQQGSRTTSMQQAPLSASAWHPERECSIFTGARPSMLRGRFPSQH